MNIKLPEDKTKVLEGHHPAEQVAESLIVAYWLHTRDDGTALYHLKSAHESMHRLADALGYTLTPKDQ
jgi:hypothetical protein